MVETKIMNDPRNHILKRIKASLKNKAPQPPPCPGEGVFQPIPSSQLTERFSKELLALKGEWGHAHSLESAVDWVHSFMARHQLKSAACAPWGDCPKFSEKLKCRQLKVGEPAGHSLAHFDLGITACEYLVAHTGTVVISPRTGHGRVLSLLPDAHLVLARPAQILPGMDDARRQLQQTYGTRLPSMITFITGPSRTADIEKIIVLGAHGPKIFGVLLLDDPSKN